MSKEVIIIVFYVSEDLEDEGIGMISEVLKYNRTLIKLNLQCNSVKNKVYIHNFHLANANRQPHKRKRS